MSTSAHANLVGIERPGAVFRIDGSRDLCPSDGDAAAQVYLARRVAGCPRDLLSHTRRVLLSDAMNDAGEAFAALVDLFIATGANGEALKKRLAGVCAHMLTPLQRQFLEKNFARGLGAATDVSFGRTVLSSGAGSGRALVRCP